MRLFLPFTVLPGLCPPRNVGQYCRVQIYRALCAPETELVQRGSTGECNVWLTSQMVFLQLDGKKNSPAIAFAFHKATGQHMALVWRRDCTLLPDRHGHVSVCMTRC